jgi:hypothetical protein
MGNDYELYIEIYKSADSASELLGFAGANFSVIPEVGRFSIFAGSLSLLLVCLRRRAA